MTIDKLNPLAGIILLRILREISVRYLLRGTRPAGALHNRYRTLISRSLLSTLGLASSAHAADAWPKFRGPDADGVVRQHVDLPTQWSASQNIAWRQELPGEGWSSPVVVDNRIYVTAAIAIDAPTQDPDPQSSDLALSLLMIDANSGQLIKQIEVMRQDAEQTPRVHAKNSHASPTPIVSGDRVYVHFGYQGTAALTREGDVLWTNRDLYFKPTHGNGGTPILVNDRLIFTCDGDKDPKVVALDAQSGKVVWETRRPVQAKKTFSFCTPTAIDVDGQTQIIAPGSDNVLALDPATGNVIWDVRYDGYSVVPKPVYHQGLVYVVTSFDSSKMLAIDPSGRGVVTDTHVVWQLDRNMPKTPSVVADQGLIYTISDDGIASCVDAATGEVVYRKRIGGNFSASPLLADGKLYLTSEDGVTTVIATGREFQQLATNAIGERTLASLAVAGDALILRTAEALYRIENQ